MRRALVIVFLFFGCGDSPEGATDCGSETCSAGQYCADATFSLCENGCVSDNNCLGDQTCEITDTFMGEGVCQQSDDTDSESQSATPLEQCEDACDHFQTCGLSASETAQCRSDCSGLDDNQRTAIANCDDLSCSSALTCLGVDCFADDDCGGDTCLEYECL